MADMETTRLAQMTQWQRLGLLKWARLLHGQDWDYQSGPNGYMAKMGTTRVGQMATWKLLDYQSGIDDNMAKMGTKRVAQMVTWPRLGLPEWPR